MKIERDKLNIALGKINPPACPLCQGHNWTLSDRLFQLIEYDKEKTTSGQGRRIYPVLAMTCTNCGNTYFINAIKAGVMDPEKIENADKDDRSEDVSDE